VRGGEKFLGRTIASGLEFDDAEKELYADRVLELMESEMGLEGLRGKIEYKRIYTVENFAADYNAYKGSALGLAHTLRQTAIFRPKNKSKKVDRAILRGRRDKSRHRDADMPDQR
jgi:phytoene desaturase